MFPQSYLTNLRRNYLDLPIIYSYMPNYSIAALLEVLEKKRTFTSHRPIGSFSHPWQKHPLGRLVFTEKGIIHLEVEGKKQLIPSWYCAWIPANMNHRIWSNSKDLLVRTIYFESSFCGNPHFHTPAIFNGSELFRNMIRYTEKWNENEDENPYELSFTTVIRQMMPEEMEKSFTISLHSSNDPTFQRLLEYIYQNLSTDLSIIQLAKMEHYSVRTLQRMFEKEAGITFSTYLKTARILSAIELLCSTNKNISEVAWEVGYNSLPTFSNTFKKMTGMRPEHFQKSNA